MVYQTKESAYNWYVNMNTCWLRRSFQPKVASLLVKEDPETKRRSLQYNWHYNYKVHTKPEFTAVD